MSLLLEALKRAERAKRQQPLIAENTDAPTNKGLATPAATPAPVVDSPAPPPLLELDISGLEAFEAEQNTADKQTLTTSSEEILAIGPLSEATPELHAAADIGKALEFVLEPIASPASSGLAEMTAQPSLQNASPALEWATLDIPSTDETLTDAEASNSANESIELPEINHLELPGSIQVHDPVQTADEPTADASASSPPADTSDSFAQQAPVALEDSRLDFALPEDLVIPPPPEPVKIRLELSDNSQGREPGFEQPSDSTHTLDPAAANAQSEKAASPQSGTKTDEKKTVPTPSRLEEAREKARRLLGKPAPAVPEQKIGNTTGRRKKLLFSLLIGSVLIGAAGSYYVWQEISPADQPLPALPAANDADTSSPAEMPQPAAVPETSVAASAPPSTEAPSPTTPPPVDNRPTGKSSGIVDSSAPAPQANSAISIVRNPPRIDVLDEAVRQGYVAYDRGDYSAARSQYQRAAKSDPRNRQALLGLAATEEASGNKPAAISLYTQVLSLDPRDHVAQAALLNLSAAEPIQSESRLRLLIAEQPDRAFLHFALGNALSAQSRWSEAEHAYFRATEIDPGNPDYAFNLAISLDQLHQMRPARDHYQRALDLSSRRPARFDREVARQRLEKLSIQP